MKSILIFLSILISLNFVLASTCPIGVYPCNPDVQFNNPIISTTTTNINYSTVNTNNSDYLDGYDSSYFYPNSNPKNYVNVSGSMDYTNVALVNKSNTFIPIQQMDYGLNFDFVGNPPKPTLSLIAEAGNVDIGLHYYTITYYTDIGETSSNSTGFSYNSITTDAGHGKVNITLPVSSDYRVIGRKIYRTKVGGAYYQVFLVDNIANNIDTSYIDNKTDASLTGVSGSAFWKADTTNKMIMAENQGVMLTDLRATIFGFGAGSTAFSGTMDTGGVTLIGYMAGASITTGDQNTLIGDTAGQYITTGTSNTAIGHGAVGSQSTSYITAIGRNCLSNGGYGSAGVGYSAGFYNNGLFNTFAGFSSGYGTSGMSANTANYNTALGYYSFSNLDTGDSNNIGLGAYSGKYETGSNKVYIDSLDRINESNGKLSSLIYGEVNNDRNKQNITFNAIIKLPALTQPSCDLNYNGSIIRNQTNCLNYCNGVNWINLAC